MKRLIVILAILLLPKLSNSGEYSRYVSSETVIENRAGLTVSVKRSSLSRRIEKFAVAHGADPDIAPELAELIAAHEHPRVLAAIAAKESNFRLGAKGSKGEVGAYQVLPKVWGHPGSTWLDQTHKSEQILNELISSSNGKIFDAVRKYNGSGASAVRYAQSVTKLINSI